jgi:uncharacterized lipoprotein YddW (UPF0748 family)
MSLRKATWLHALPTTPDGVQTLVHRLADAGFELLIPCVKQVDGYVDYPSAVANMHEEYRGFDALLATAEEANRVGLAVHAWCCVFPEGKGSRLIAEHPECRAVAHGRVTEEWAWACPRQTATQDYVAAIYQELLDRYPVQGVHLDYIRYADGFCYCDTCREDYRKTFGLELRDHHFDAWQHPETHDMDAWIAWRCAPVTQVVRRIRAASQAAGKQLSAAVFHYLPGQLQDVGQDWAGWLREGLLDAVMPMNYSPSTRIAAEWAHNHATAIAEVKGVCALWEGICRRTHMSTPRFLEHVNAIAAQDIDGICIFDEPNITDEDLCTLHTV